MKRDLRPFLEPVSEIDPAWPRVSVSDSIQAVARVLSNRRADAALVYDGEELVGRVTGYSLLSALADDIDPLTGLARAGGLRDWITNHLAEGHEVALIFLDLDQFRQVNTNQGHTAGDELLCSFATAVAAAADPETDLCARYGGDEFVIATLKTRTEAESWARATLQDLPASATFGFSGGRRHSPRSDANIGSTVEELIRLASLDCMSKKSR